MAEARFRAVLLETLRIASLDTLTLVYHRASGTTHIVASPVPEILDALNGPARTLGELMVLLGATFELADASNDALSARLDELVSSGLVEAL